MHSEENQRNSFRLVKMKSAFFICMLHLSTDCGESPPIKRVNKCMWFHILIKEKCLYIQIKQIIYDIMLFVESQPSMPFCFLNRTNFNCLSSPQYNNNNNNNCMFIQ